MAISATDTRLRFLSGLSTNLANVEVTNGNVYVTTDEHIMYADLGGQRLRLSDVVWVDTQADLPTFPPESQKNALYYVKNGNILCCYNNTANGGSWTQINAVPTLASIIASSATTYSTVTANTAAQAKLTLKDKNGTDVTGNFKVLVSSGNTSTIAVNSDSTNGITITAADTIVKSDLSASAASNVATITLTETTSGYNADGSAKTETTEDKTLKIANGGGIAITTTGGEQINLTATPTASTPAFDANGALTVDLTMADGAHVKSKGSVTPTITYGVNTTMSAVFKSGTANLSGIYTATEVDAAINEKLRTAQAMVFAGTVGGNTQLPVSAAHGATYIVDTAGDIKDADGTTVASGAKVGDMFIASGTENSSGLITDITWNYVPAGNDDAYTYTGSASNTQLVLNEKLGGVSKGAVATLNIGDGLTGSGSGSALTIAHPTKSVTEDTSTATITTTFTAISAVGFDEYGHVNKVTTGTYTIPNNAIASVTQTVTAASNVATVKTEVKQSSGNTKSDTITIESENLEVTANTAGTGVAINLTWYEF